MSGTPRVVVPCGCGRGARVAIEAPSGSADARAECPACARPIALRLEGRTREGGLGACLGCGHPELYTRKAFPAWAGFAIVAVAAVTAPFTRYLSLVAAAALDLALYHLVPEVVVCYVCGARHRGFVAAPRHPRFDREIAERLRFGARAVMGKPMRPGGTADAPEPEH